MKKNAEWNYIFIFLKEGSVEERGRAGVDSWVLFRERKMTEERSFHVTFFLYHGLTFTQGTNMQRLYFNKNGWWTEKSLSLEKGRSHSVESKYHVAWKRRGATQSMENIHHSAWKRGRATQSMANIHHSAWKKGKGHPVKCKYSSLCLEWGGVTSIAVAFFFSFLFE